jgi:hypothetical protein
MELFHQMAYLASAELLGVSARHRITNQKLAEELESLALSDRELAEHYACLVGALPALQAQRALEDTEVGASPLISPMDHPRAA